MNMKVTKLKKNGSLLPGHSRGVFFIATVRQFPPWQPLGGAFH